jgi:hypothetical protein
MKRRPSPKRTRRDKGETTIDTALEQLDKLLESPITRSAPLVMHIDQAFTQASYFLLSEGGAEERREARRHLRRVNQYSTGNDGDNALLWKLSLVGFALYRRGGEVQALKVLPALIAIDCKFSLAQPWIRSLISCWHEPEDEKKILHIFFGTPNRGHRTHKLLIENWRRDQKIIAAVAQLIGGGCSQNEATRRVVGKLEELGIRECLSARNIRRIYKEPDSLISSLGSLFSFS